MKPLLALAALLAAAALPGSAQACRSAASAMYVVLKDPPSRLPPGAILLKVRMIGKLPYHAEDLKRGARAHVLAGRGAGRTVRLVPDRWTSCDAWFEGDPTGYVVAFPNGPGRFDVIGYRSRRYRTPSQDRSEGVVHRPSRSPD